jgi:hypothetical protein
MALGSCKECGDKVSSGAKTCPHCGVKKPYKKIARKATFRDFILLMVGLVVVLIIADRSDSNEGTSKPKVETKTVSKVSSKNKVFVCRAFISNAYGKPISIINHKKTDANGVVYVGYKRSDGTLWDYGCRVNSSTAVYSAWIKDSQKWGRWRDDEKATFSYKGDSLIISDPISGSKTYKIPKS